MYTQPQVNPALSVGIGIVALALVVVAVLAQWRMYAKAGEPGWAAIVPFYSQYVLFRIAGLNPWLFLLLVVPVANVVVIVMSALGIGKAFGKSVAWSLVLLWLFSLVGYLILGFGPDQYRRPVGGPTYA